MEEENKTKLRDLVRPNHRFVLDIPERLKRFKVTRAYINVRFRWLEYQYIPSFSYFIGTSLTSDELRAIADKLDKLNEEFKKWFLKY